MKKEISQTQITNAIDDKQAEAALIKKNKIKNIVNTIIGALFVVAAITVYLLGQLELLPEKEDAPLLWSFSGLGGAYVLTGVQKLVAGLKTKKS